MDTVFLIVSIILIIVAELLYWKKSSRNTIMTKGQKALAVFQIALCGGFFFLCLSAVLDIKVNFSAVRTAVNIYYAMTFLSMTAFALSDLRAVYEACHIRFPCADPSCEPCFMCSGAMVWVRLGRLVYGASNTELENILGNEGCNCSRIVFDNSFWKPEVSAGILKEQAIEVLKDYFEKHEKG